MQSQYRKSAGFIPSPGGALFVASLILSSQAHAADIYSQPVSLKDSPVLVAPVLWSGLYAGGHAGGVWGGAEVSDTFEYGGDPAFKGNLGGAGFIGGAQAGYNVQRDYVLFGLEGDIGYLGFPASKAASFRPDICATQPVGSCDMDTIYSSTGGLYGDFTGRLGYVADRTLLYVKGGVAFLDADFKAGYSGQNYTTIGHLAGSAPSTFNYSHSDTLVGWTVGAGVEYALTPSWSVKAEYRHFDFGDISYTYSGRYRLPNGIDSTLIGRTDVSFTADAVTIGLNYHLNSGASLK